MSVGAVVDLYCLPGCAKCASVQRWLNRLGRPMVMHDVSADDAARAEVERLGFRSLPVVVTPDGRAAWGAEPDKLMGELPQLAEAEQGATIFGRT
jgi:glutaredoxin-like protein NrdH